MRGHNDRLKLGDWNVVCDLTGFKMKASQVVRRWDGFMVRRKSSEERHPQDFLRAVPDDMSVPFARPVPAPTFIEPYAAAQPFDPSTLGPGNQGSSL